MRAFTHRWLPILLALLILLPAPARRKGGKRDRNQPPPELPAWAAQLIDEPVAEAFPEADAVTVLDSWEMEVEKGVRSGTRRRMVRVLTEEGRDHVQLVLFRGTFVRHDDVRLWVRDPGGDVELYRQDDGSLYSTTSREMLEDDSALVIDPPGVRPGTVVVLESRFTVSAELPQDQFAIRGEIPTWKARVVAETKDAWAFRGRVVGGDDPGPEEVTRSGVWEFDRVPALKLAESDNAPVPPGLAMTVEFIPPKGESTFPDWNGTARWIVALFEEDADMTPVREAAERMGESEDPIRAVGRFVRQMRYFGVEIGWGGWKPRSPVTTLRRGFGDCKDKSFLMVSLLRQLGIEAVPVIVIAPEDGYVYDELPGPFQFNHCIVGMPPGGAGADGRVVVTDSPGTGPLRLFDPTLSEDFPADVSPSLEGGRGLAIDPRSTGLLEVPRSSISENESVTSFRARLDANGTFSVEMRRSLTGARTYNLWDDDGQVMEIEDLRTDVAKEFARDCPGLTAIDVAPPAQSDDGAWVYEASFTQPDALAGFGDVSVLALPTFAGLWNFPLPDEDEPETLYQYSLRRTREIWSIDVSGRSLLSLPQGFEESRPLGSVRVSFAREGDTVHLERELEVTSIEVPPERREDARALRNALRRANDVLLMFKGDIPPS